MCDSAIPGAHVRSSKCTLFPPIHTSCRTDANDTPPEKRGPKRHARFCPGVLPRLLQKSRGPELGSER
eukprot:12629511-Alexandrium_andersonii.AAC.1